MKPRPDHEPQKRGTRDVHPRDHDRASRLSIKSCRQLRDHWPHQEDEDQPASDPAEEARVDPGLGGPPVEVTSQDQRLRGAQGSTEQEHLPYKLYDEGAPSDRASSGAGEYLQGPRL